MMELVVLLFTLAALVGGIVTWWCWRFIDNGAEKKAVLNEAKATRARRGTPEDSISFPLRPHTSNSFVAKHEDENSRCVEQHDKSQSDKSLHHQYPETGSETDVPLTSDSFLDQGISSEQLGPGVKKQGEPGETTLETEVEGLVVSEKVASKEGVSGEVVAQEVASQRLVSEGLVSEERALEEQVLEERALEQVALEERALEQVALEERALEQVGSEKVVFDEAHVKEMATEKGVAEKRALEEVASELHSEKVTLQEVAAENVAAVEEEMTLEGVVPENAVSPKPQRNETQSIGSTGEANTLEKTSGMPQTTLKESRPVQEQVSECSRSQAGPTIAETARASVKTVSSVEDRESSEEHEASELRKKLCWVKARALERLGVKGVEFAVKHTTSAAEQRKRRRQCRTVASTVKSRKGKRDSSERDESEWQSEEDTSTEDDDHQNYDEDASILAAYASRMIESPEEARIEAEQLKAKGNACFKQKQVDEALQHYTEAIVVAPTLDLLSVLLSNRAACFTMQQEYGSAIEECTDGLSLDPTFAKLYLRRFRAYEAQEKWHDALTDINKALELDPSLRPTYRDIRQRVEKLSQEEFERQKQEMLDKLKTFGNWALGKVGLSMDNFKLEQNPETGAYNISYQQNAPA